MVSFLFYVLNVYNDLIIHSKLILHEYFLIFITWKGFHFLLLIEVSTNLFFYTAFQRIKEKQIISKYMYIKAQLISLRYYVFSLFNYLNLKNIIIVIKFLNIVFSV